MKRKKKKPQRRELERIVCITVFLEFVRSLVELIRAFRE